MAILQGNHPCSFTPFIDLQGGGMKDFLLSVTYHVIFLFERIFRAGRKARFKGVDISDMKSLNGFKKEH